MDLRTRKKKNAIGSGRTRSQWSLHCHPTLLQLQGRACAFPQVKPEKSGKGKKGSEWVQSHSAKCSFGPGSSGTFRGASKRSFLRRHQKKVPQNLQTPRLSTQETCRPRNAQKAPLCSELFPGFTPRKHASGFQSTKFAACRHNARKERNEFNSRRLPPPQNF